MRPSRRPQVKMYPELVGHLVRGGYRLGRPRGGVRGRRQSRTILGACHAELGRDAGTLALYVYEFSLYVYEFTAQKVGLSQHK